MLSVGIKGRKHQINSVPQLGQHLINAQLESDYGYRPISPPMVSQDSLTNSLMSASLKSHETIELPASAVKQQADAAIHHGNVTDRQLEQEHASQIIARREKIRKAVFQRKAKRELLETRSGQRPEDAMQKATAFYEGIYGEVSITIKEARNIEMADANGTDPFCRLHFDGEVKETSVQWNTLNPIWNETFTFKLDSEEDLSDTIKVRTTPAIFTSFVSF